MKINASITFLSEQQYENDSDKSELKANGTIEKTNDGFIIEYTEPDEEMGKSISSIHIFNNSLVHLRRSGLYEAHFIIEHRKKHHCIYKTPFGEMDMEIFADKVIANITEKGGNIYLKYRLESNSQIIGENTLIMSIKAIA